MRANYRCEKRLCTRKVQHVRTSDGARRAACKHVTRQTVLALQSRSREEKINLARHAHHLTSHPLQEVSAAFCIAIVIIGRAVQVQLVHNCGIYCMGTADCSDSALYCPSGLHIDDYCFWFREHNPICSACKRHKSEEG